MTELDVIRPLVNESLAKFRFGITSFLLRGLALNLRGNDAFVKHLADIYDNWNITLASPEQDLTSLRTIAVPILPERMSISEVESRHYASEKERLSQVLSRLGQCPASEAAGYLLKSYYCLANGFNFGAVVTFGKAIRAHSSGSRAAFEGAELIITQINEFVEGALQYTAGRPLHPVNFSFYMEFERARLWLRDELGVDIYALQDDITPRFRFGGA